MDVECVCLHAYTNEIDEESVWQEGKCFLFIFF